MPLTLSKYRLESNYVYFRAYLDKRRPVVRRIYRELLEEALEEDEGKPISRQIVDRMLGEFEGINQRVVDAVGALLSRPCEF